MVEIEKQFVQSADELIVNCKHFLALAESTPAAQKFLKGRFKNIRRFVAITEGGGKYLFAPGAYVAVSGASNLNEWKQIGTKKNRTPARKHLDKHFAEAIVKQGHSAYDELKQAYEDYCLQINATPNKKRKIIPVEFWYITPEIQKNRVEEHNNATSSRGVEGEEWTQEELSAAISAYLQILDKEQQGVPYTKKYFLKLLNEGVLQNRSMGSIEWRMQNISAVLEELCLPRIMGYKPARHIGNPSKAKIKAILAAQGAIELDSYAATSDHESLNRQVNKIRQKFSPGKPKGNPTPSSLSAVTTVFDRDPLVIAWVLEQAGEYCECCSAKAPFIRTDGRPYLEVHHVRTLANGGSDVIENAVAICPNCHRNLHYGQGREIMIENLYKKIVRLTPL